MSLSNSLNKMDVFWGPGPLMFIKVNIWRQSEDTGTISKEFQLDITVSQVL